ncbi:MAG: hypothetical protein Q8T09_16210 [Candidatus Melainabacteria bacterium]|nr:hypothetical protein [Candidatus Melainabacteria bacterium]
MILHNADLGPQILAYKFPNQKQLHSIALKHISEDLGCEPSLEDWLKHCNLERLPKIPYRFKATALTNAVEAVANKLPLENATPKCFGVEPAEVAQSTSCFDDKSDLTPWRGLQVGEILWDWREYFGIQQWKGL